MQVGPREFLEPDQAKVAPRDFEALPARQATHELQTKHHVAQRIQPREQRRFLEHHQAVTVRSGDDLPVRSDLATARSSESGDDV